MSQSQKDLMKKVIEQFNLADTSIFLNLMDEISSNRHFEIG